MKRDLEFQNISRYIGLSYAEHIDKLPEYIIDNEFLLFASFNIHRKKGLPTCFKNILTGELDGFEMFLADFRSDYSVDEFGYNQTIAILRSINFSFQKFYLMPIKAERFTVKLDHIGQDFILPIIKNYKKIQFSSHPQLNSKYILKAQGAHLPQELLNMSFIKYLEGHSRWFLEGSSDSLLVYRRGEKIKSSGLRKYIDDVLEIGRLLLVEKT